MTETKQTGRYGGEIVDFEQGVGDLVVANAGLSWKGLRAAIMSVVAHYDALNPCDVPSPTSRSGITPGLEARLINAVRSSTDDAWPERKQVIIDALRVYDDMFPHDTAPPTQTRVKSAFADITPSRLLAALDAFPPRWTASMLRFADALAGALPPDGLARTVLVTQMAEAIVHTTVTEDQEQKVTLAWHALEAALGPNQDNWPLSCPAARRLWEAHFGPL
jgi:hypothetical protein